MMGIDRRNAALKKAQEARKGRYTSPWLLFNNVLCNYKSNAKRRGLEFNIPVALFYVLTQSRCYYCGCKPAAVSTNSYRTDCFVYNGLDRLDSGLGYTPENVVSCCKFCNWAKSDRSSDDFKKWIQAAAQWQKDWSADKEVGLL